MKKDIGISVMNVVAIHIMTVKGGNVKNVEIYIMLNGIIESYKGSE